MTDTFTYEETDIPATVVQDTLPNMPADDVPAAHDYEYACIKCGKEIFYGGRGPKPKYCDDDKRSNSRSGAKTGVRSTAGKWQEPLQTALANQFIMIGMVAYPFNAFDGTTIINGSPALASSLIGVAEQSPAVRDALQKFVTAGAWSQVAAAVAQIVIPIAINHQWLPQMKIPGFTAAVPV